ncbi:MAG TPA: hypothetical protein DIT13_13805, partial [Verrucomicrobiales bacterium]|nr:hypothetical protein [Verrucomicrobiales bacterium]
MSIPRLISLSLVFICAIHPVSAHTHREVVLGLLLLLGLLEAGRGVETAGTATEQLRAWLGRLVSLSVWPFHAAVLALAFLGLSAHEGPPAAKIVSSCATCAGAKSSGCGGSGGGGGGSPAGARGGGGGGENRPSCWGGRGGGGPPRPPPNGQRGGGGEEGRW